MKTSKKFMARGVFHTLRGTAKKIAGNITSNTRLEVRGKFERFTGKVQWKVGKTQALFGF